MCAQKSGSSKDDAAENGETQTVPPTKNPETSKRDKLIEMCVAGLNDRYEKCHLYDMMNINVSCHVK